MCETVGQVFRLAAFLDACAHRGKKVLRRVERSLCYVLWDKSFSSSGSQFPYLRNRVFCRGKPTSTCGHLHPWHQSTHPPTPTPNSACTLAIASLLESLAEKKDSGLSLSEPAFPDVVCAQGPFFKSH